MHRFSTEPWRIKQHVSIFRSEIFQAYPALTARSKTTKTKIVAHPGPSEGGIKNNVSGIHRDQPGWAMCGAFNRLREGWYVYISYSKRNFLRSIFSVVVVVVVVVWSLALLCVVCNPLPPFIRPSSSLSSTPPSSATQPKSSVARRFLSLALLCRDPVLGRVFCVYESRSFTLLVLLLSNIALKYVVVARVFVVVDIRMHACLGATSRNEPVKTSSPNPAEAEENSWSIHSN